MAEDCNATKDKERKPLQIYKASAGSGKTFTLAVEYISLLALNPTEYQNILAVTFTNKATAEMKQRILGTLYGIGNGLSNANKYIKPILENVERMRKMPQYQEEPYRSALRDINEETLRMRVKEALSNIIHDYSRFRIETIDSFFQSIVREIANELELPTNLKVELDEAEVLSDAVDDIIDNLREGSNDFNSIIDFVEDKIRTGHSWQVDEVVKDFGKNIFKENYLIHGEDIRKKITNKASIDKYRHMVQSYLNQHLERVTEMGTRFLQAYEQGGCTDKDCTTRIVTFFEKVRDNDIKMPTSSSEGTFTEKNREHAIDVEKWFKKSSKNRDALQPYVEEVLMPMVEETYQRFETYKGHEQTVAAVTQYLYNLMLLNEISEKVKTLNTEKNHFLLSETANFLRNVINGQNIPFIYEKIGSVIKHIMIDEFQDTSALQWGNFKPLILNSLSTGGTCLIVGDVKQSIYRFRNSDWQILNHLEQDPDLAEQMSHIPAKYNFRSSRHIVDFNNNLFLRAIDLLKAQCPALTTAYGDVQQEPFQKGEDAGYIKVENIDYHDIDAENVPEPWDRCTPQNYDEAMLQHLQLSVKELIDNGVSANDITILIRTNKEVASISDYFNQHTDVLDVKIVSDDAFRLDASPAINIIIYALRALTTQDDKLHLATLAYYYQTLVVGNPSLANNISIPFLAQTTADIDAYLPNQFNQFHRRDLQFKAITQQIEDIYQIFQLNRLPRQDSYLFFFNDLVEQFCEDNSSDLDTFLQAWDEKLCEKTIPNGASDGVRIMTMHKSKGLEFHSVVIPSCSWQIKPKDTEVMWCIPREAPYNAMPLLPISVRKATPSSIFADDRNQEELRTLVDNINVLYVAFTRAKHNLVILTGNKIGDAIDPTAPIESAQSFLVRSMPPTMKQQDIEGIITTYQTGTIVPTTPEKEAEEKNALEQDYAPLSVSFTSHPTEAAFRQSYESDLFITADSLNPKVQQHAQRIRLISLGNLYHHIFQLVRTIADVPRAVRLLESKGLFGTLLDAADAQKTVTRLIEDITPTHPEWFSPDWTVLTERAILFLDSDGIPTTRRPDRVIVQGDQAIVIDYKTAQGVVHTGADGTPSAPAEHVHQIKGYKDRLAQLGYFPVRAYLWYILDGCVVEV
ncbi:MAG: UvrD-helicase domain-containing protein [Bacteroidaceae bacterium]|nr:UvrD-helicase domain-containing protein [Bacteroidaceae bacterium]